MSTRLRCSYLVRLKILRKPLHSIHLYFYMILLSNLPLLFVILVFTLTLILTSKYMSNQLHDHASFIYGEFVLYDRGLISLWLNNLLVPSFSPGLITVIQSSLVCHPP